MQNQIVYVVLHYKSADETDLCISKLLRLKNKKIVVVCNGSGNGSDAEVSAKYANNPDVAVLVNNENLGFANGLNIGIRYARDTMDAECIVCINNDVYIDQPDFTEEILRLYQTYDFAVAAPDVVNLDGIHCNPGYIEVPTEKKLQEQLRYLHRRFQCSKYLFGIPEMGYRAFERIQRKISPKKHSDGTLLVLHGCCWILSKKYFERFDGIYPKTYLYGEEPILSYLCHLHNMKMMYLPSLKVVHGESVATKQEWSSFGKRKQFYYKHLIHSTEMLLELVNTGMAEIPEN